MVRATVVVSSVFELWDAYRWLKESGIVEILSVKDMLTSDLGRVLTVVFKFDDKIIGEMKFRYESAPP